MRTTVSKGSETAGLPPGTLVHVGEERTGKVRITVLEVGGR